MAKKPKDTEQTAVETDKPAEATSATQDAAKPAADAQAKPEDAEQAKTKEYAEIAKRTVGTVGRDLLQALLQELKLLPDAWPKMAEKKQNEVIDRLRDRVEHNVGLAVDMPASEDRVTVRGTLGKIAIAAGDVQGTLKFSPSAPNLHGLYDCAGKSVIVIVADLKTYTGGMSKVRGESDQRALKLGQEYDPKGDGKGMPGDLAGAAVAHLQEKGFDASPVMTPEEEVEHWRNLGADAAAEGTGLTECPPVEQRFSDAWVKGWEAWHANNREKQAA